MELLYRYTVMPIKIYRYPLKLHYTNAV